MKTKIYFSVILLLAINILVIAGDNVTRMNKNLAQMDAYPLVYAAPYNYNPESIVFIPQLASGFSTDSLVVGPEIFTSISGFYDYKTNGETNVYIQVDPLHKDTIHVCDVTADTTDPVGSTTRRTKYAFSTNGGLTWETGIEVPDAIRSGYPVIQLLNGSAVIANHNTAISGQLNINLYHDLAPLAGVFTQIGHPSPTPFGIWPQISVYSNGNVGVLGRRNVSTNGPETLYYSVYNGSTLSAWTPVYFTTNNYLGSVGSNMRFHIANNSNGRVTIIIAPVLQNDTLDASRIYQRTSVDNGVTWGPVQTVFSPYMINGGNDTVIASGGSGFAYKRNSNNWFLAYPISQDGLFSTASLVLTKGDGTTTTTTTITTAAAVGAAGTYAQNMAFVFSIDFPALGWSADGSTLYCAYSVVKDDTSRGFNQRDIYCQYSLNDGATWSAPVRLTNTPTIDETYPSVSAWNRGTPGAPYELNLTYMKDPGVGPTSFNGGGTTGAPSRNSLVYRKITGLSPIGILNNQNLLKDYRLTQNYPNPFNPNTTIEYNIVKQGHVSLKIYDVLGREVASLVNEVQNAGAKSVDFNAANLSSGVYFYTLKSGDFTDTKTMVLVK
jgi:hypothetical protein